MLASSGALAPSAPASSALVLTPEQMTATILELGQVVAGIRAFLVGPYEPQPQPLLPPPPPPHQQQLPLLPLFSAATTAPVISYQYGMPLLDIINGNTSAAPPSSTIDLVVEDPVLQQGAVAVDGIDHHDLVDATTANETLEHALHMEELMQITDCNQLRGFDEAPAAVHFAESDRIDSAVVAAPPSLTTSPAAPSAAIVVPV